MGCFFPSAGTVSIQRKLLCKNTVHSSRKKKNFVMGLERGSSLCARLLMPTDTTVFFFLAEPMSFLGVTYTNMGKELLTGVKDTQR